MHKLAVANPKQSRHLSGKEGWYPYYAGFSTEFVRSALGQYAPVGKLPVLDPWNGGGTTTQISSELGFNSIGCDLNPVMLVVAKARRLQSTVKESISPLAAEILKTVEIDALHRNDAEDPLTAWLTPQSIVLIRSIERSIRNHFVPNASSSNISELICTQRFSDLAAYFYLILFRTVRQLLSPFGTSNPTWVRVPAARQRLRPNEDTIKDAFKASVKSTIEGFSDGMQVIAEDTQSRFFLADSRTLPIVDCSVGAILTSPPYLTRLDYAIATGPELAVLGYGAKGIRELRDKMIGTTTIMANQETVCNLNGYAKWCLERIASHDSKASKSYYHKNISQYFQGLALSLDEGIRTLAPNGYMTLVVQDSYYKDIHLDLPKIVLEHGISNGMTLVDMHPFQVQRHFGSVHPHHRKYSKEVGRVETVVVLRKSQRVSKHGD